MTGPFPDPTDWFALAIKFTEQPRPQAESTVSPASTPPPVPPGCSVIPLDSRRRPT